MLNFQRTGTENYTAQIVYGLLDQSLHADYRLYFNSRRFPAELRGRADIRSMPWPRLWTHLRLSFELLAHPPDLLFVPAHVIPLWHPRSVVTVHDLGYLHHPESHSRRQRLVLDATTRWSVHAASHVIVPSHATGNDLANHYGVSSDRFSVIYHGLNERFSTISTSEADAVRIRHHLYRPYVLAVGTIHPRKNYGRLAAAVARLIERGHDIELVISGKPGWLADKVLGDLNSTKLGDRLRLLHYVPDEDLPGLYAGALVFAMPSLYEGFGLPLIEAMASGVPTVSANRSSLPEIAGNASKLFNPFSTEDIESALDSVLNRPEQAESLRSAGHLRAAEFTWSRAARQTGDVFCHVLDRTDFSE